MRELLLLVLLVPFALMFALSDSLSKFTMPTESAHVVNGIVMPVPTPSAFVGPPSNLVEAAMQWLGVPYLWGGCSHQGVDCSCFVKNVLATVGIKAPRTTVGQIAWATPVTRDQIEVGDLVFFNNTCSNCGANPTHVGLAIGGGLMINAGNPVQIQPIFGSMQYAGAGRPHP